MSYTIFLISVTNVVNQCLEFAGAGRSGEGVGVGGWREEEGSGGGGGGERGGGEPDRLVIDEPRRVSLKSVASIFTLAGAVSQKVKQPFTCKFMQCSASI